MFVDMGALWVALHWLHTDLYLGRVFSFWCAASVTWLCNRNITFRETRSRSIVVEYIKFIGVSLFGGFINVSVYAVVVGVFSKTVRMNEISLYFLPYFGVMLGSLSGLVFNYAGARNFVFRRSGGRKG